jgi:hypothetical protein
MHQTTVQFVTNIICVTYSGKRGLRLPINVHHRLLIPVPWCLALQVFTLHFLTCHMSWNRQWTDGTVVDLKIGISRKLLFSHSHKTPYITNKRYLPLVPLPFRRCSNLALRTVNRLVEFLRPAQPSWNSGLPLLKARNQVEAVHNVGRNDTTHVILLLLSLWSSPAGKLAASCLKVTVSTLSRDMGLGREGPLVGTGQTTCKETGAIMLLRTLDLQFNYI